MDPHLICLFNCPFYPLLSDFFSFLIFLQWPSFIIAYWSSKLQHFFDWFLFEIVKLYELIEDSFLIISDHHKDGGAHLENMEFPILRVHFCTISFGFFLGLLVETANQYGRLLLSLQLLSFCLNVSSNGGALKSQKMKRPYFSFLNGWLSCDFSGSNIWPLLKTILTLNKGFSIYLIAIINSDKPIKFVLLLEQAQ